MTSKLFAALQVSLPRAGFTVAVVSLTALLAAYVAQYGLGLEPCVLCIYQRIPYAIVIFLGFYATYAKPLYARVALMICAACFFAGAGIAAFHVGVEQHWWEGTDSCGLELDAANIETLRAQILNAPRARCDDIPWSFLGISMAGYNVLFSSMLAVFAFMSCKKRPLTQGDASRA